MEEGSKRREEETKAETEREIQQERERIVVKILVYSQLVEK